METFYAGKEVEYTVLRKCEEFLDTEGLAKMAECIAQGVDKAWHLWGSESLFNGRVFIVVIGDGKEESARLRWSAGVGVEINFLPSPGTPEFIVQKYDLEFATSAAKTAARIAARIRGVLPNYRKILALIREDILEHGERLQLIRNIVNQVLGADKDLRLGYIMEDDTHPTARVHYDTTNKKQPHGELLIKFGDVFANTDNGAVVMDITVSPEQALRVIEALKE